MKIGMIGLGRMGASMVKRLVADGHECVVFDQNEAARKALAQPRVTVVASLQGLVTALDARRVVWRMLPAGGPTEDTVRALVPMLKAQDTLVDGGNSHYKDGMRRATELARHGIDFVDAGVSGGVWGLERGYCLMVGGRAEVISRLDPIFKSLTSKQDRGFVHCGDSGSGHFVKMIHNGIEYGMMQSLAEGFHILQSSPFELDLPAVSEAWRHGSVVSSWLLDLASMALKEDPRLAGYEGIVQDSGEGRWTLQAAIEQSVPAEVLATSLFVRFRSREPRSFAEKLLSAMRHGFGGHQESGPQEQRKGA
jgi:6-phosphogluconate dehydrogenase